MVGGRRPSGEDDLRWKTTSKQDRRLRFGMLTVLTNERSIMVLCLMEDNLWRKTTFSGRRPSVEDDLRWNTTFGGRPLLSKVGG